jgi:hypothetical protein
MISPPDATIKQIPYRPAYRHGMRFIDIRYLVKLDERWVYSICILEGYSRKILAGMASEYQDLTATLQLLFATLSECGRPEMLISDNGAGFKAQDYQAILAALHIEATYIEQGKPFQNLIEAQFKLQLRLAGFKFEKAETLEEIQALHAEFIETFSATAHWAHQDREDGRRTPVEVLDWVRGRTVDPAELRRAFRQVQFTRTVNRYGYVSIQRFCLYAEWGLSRRRVSVWICEGQFHIKYQEIFLARYQCEYDRRQKHLESVSQPVLCQTPFVSLQLELFKLDDEQWLKVYRRSYQRRKRPSYRRPNSSHSAG